MDGRSDANDFFASPEQFRSRIRMEGSTGRNARRRRKTNKKKKKAVRSFTSLSCKVSNTVKSKIWDSDEIFIDSTLTLVELWQKMYESSKAGCRVVFEKVHGLYKASKSGAESFENALLLPVRDYVILPVFVGVERTAQFFFSPQLSKVCSLALVKIEGHAPFGRVFIVPVLRSSHGVAAKTLRVLQYPIPSSHTVTTLTTTAANRTKWALSVVCSEAFFYANMLDVHVTRALAKAQWNILKSGPYLSLSDEQKADVLGHVCERYLAVPDAIARYEFASHVKHKNLPLYEALVGLLRQRGSNADDSWLDDKPTWRRRVVARLEGGSTSTIEVVPLFFYLPVANGTGTSEWKRFNERDRRKLEQHHQSGRWKGAQPPPKQRQTAEEEDALSRWYEPTERDVFVDKGRHVVTWSDSDAIETKLSMKPVFWRFYANGDPCRRSYWMQDSGSNDGLQPYSESSAAILEDAYQFLNHVWHSKIKRGDDSEPVASDLNVEDDSTSVLLTVQVQGPDGEDQLVQFRSLRQVFAVKKTLGGALSYRKKRVYRGAEVSIGKSSPPPGNVEDNVYSNSAGTSIVEEFCDKGNEDGGEGGDSGTMSSLAAPLQFSSSPECQFSAFGDDVEDKDEVDHLILVVHGIGKAMQSFELFGLVHLSSIIDCCISMRQNYEEVMDQKSSSTEFIPIEWHEKFQRLSRNNHVASSGPGLNDITLDTVGHLRAFANDAMLDTLYFMSEAHHDQIINLVVTEMNTVVQKFRKYKGKAFSNAKISIVAHSLGSIITWDILANQRRRGSYSEGEVLKTPEFLRSRKKFNGGFKTPDSSPSHSSDGNGNVKKFGALSSLFGTPQSDRSAEGELTSSYPQISFQVSHTFMLGSPVAVFLLIRNQESPLQSDYSLPGCSRVYNVFHPYDVAAYRLEPLINRKNANVEPCIVPTYKGDYRVKYKAKILWRRVIAKLKTTKSDIFTKMEEGACRLGLIDPSITHLEPRASGDTTDDDSVATSDTTASDSENDDSIDPGWLCGGGRVDFVLQEKEIESTNEYLFALGAHSMYWNEKDLVYFIFKELRRDL